MSAPVVFRHPIARRLVDELGATLVGWVDRSTGEIHTEKDYRYGKRAHPELVRALLPIAHELAKGRDDRSMSR